MALPQFLRRGVAQAHSHTGFGPCPSMLRRIASPCKPRKTPRLVSEPCLCPFPE
jgi:hypothetical protein